MTVFRVQMEELVLRIQTHAYHRALVIAHERRAVIEAVAEEMLANGDATVAGARLDELLRQPPADVPEAVIEELPFKNLIPDEVRLPSHNCPSAPVRVPGCTCTKGPAVCMHEMDGQVAVC